MVKKVEQKKTTKKAVKQPAKKVANKTVKTQKVSVKDAVCKCGDACKCGTMTVFGYEIEKKYVWAAGAVVVVLLLCALF
jgi:hypothetical protein